MPFHPLAPSCSRYIKLIFWVPVQVSNLHSTANSDETQKLGRVFFHQTRENHKRIVFWDYRCLYCHWWVKQSVLFRQAHSRFQKMFCHHEISKFFRGVQTLWRRVRMETLSSHSHFNFATRDVAGCLRHAHIQWTVAHRLCHDCAVRARVKDDHRTTSPSGAGNTECPFSPL